jgi:hypothetical protein
MSYKKSNTGATDKSDLFQASAQMHDCIKHLSRGDQVAAIRSLVAGLGLDPNLATIPRVPVVTQSPVPTPSTSYMHQGSQPVQAKRPQTVAIKGAKSLPVGVTSRPSNVYTKVHDIYANCKNLQKLTDRESRISNQLRKFRFDRKSKVHINLPQNLHGLPAELAAIRKEIKAKKAQLRASNNINDDLVHTKPKNSANVQQKVNTDSKLSPLPVGGTDPALTLNQLSLGDGMEVTQPEDAANREKS